MSADQSRRRYIRQRDFIEYAKHLGLSRFGLEGELELAERLAIVTPAARVRFPDDVVRRWHRDKYPGNVVTEPIEPDGPRLAAANVFRNVLASDCRREFPGMHHTLDVLAEEHRPFVSKTFTRDTFVPWERLRTLIRRADPAAELSPRHRRHDYYESDGVITYYHAWQVFQLGAFLRSGITVLYDVSVPHTHKTLFDLDLPKEDILVSINLEARDELKTLHDNAHLFDAVATYDDLSDRALQDHAAYNVDPETRRLSAAASKSLTSRKKDIARSVMARASLTPKDLISFLRVQCGLWDEARARSAPMVEAYKQSIKPTIELLQRASPRHGRSLVKQVGAIGGWHRPLLPVIFPDWIEEQRQIVEPSLRQWIVPRLAQMPAPFAFGESDVAPFCDWIERNGFLQLYWHFRRLTDIGPFDDDIGRTAATVEVIGLATLVEHLTTVVLAERTPPVTEDTLFPKVSALLRKHDPALAAEFTRNGKRAPSDEPVMNTKKYSLRKQLDRIRRGRAAAPTAPVLKAMQRLVLIRNATSHGRLPGYQRHELQRLVESLLIAALLVWKAR
jgi:hypothetical protein